MTPAQAETITSFIAEHQVADILELGFCHGISTCYMAAALSELGRGSITAIDLQLDPSREDRRRTCELTPNIDTLLDRVGQRHRVNVFYEPTSYTWRLMRFLEEDPTPRFDLCYLDGAHSWFVDGFAFFLVNRLLRPGGWIIFDDVEWTYAQSPAVKDSELVRHMPQDERTTSHVRKIYELLVKTDPHYHNFRVESGWAYAQKRSDGFEAGQREVVTEKIVQVERVTVGVGAFLMKVMKKIQGRSHFSRPQPR